MRTFLWVIPLFGLCACRQIQSKPNTKTLDFGAFTIETPKSWTQIKERGTDSYVGRIAIDEKDTIDFDLGWYSNKLEEFDPVIMDSSMMADVDTSKEGNRDIIWVKNSRAVDPDNYRKNNVSWDTFDGRRAKIVYPRQAGIGTTGVYIDTLWISRGAVDHFSLYGDNLKADIEKEVLQAIRTLKFHKF